MKKALVVCAATLLLFLLPMGALADTLIIGPANGTTDPVLLYSNTSFTVTNNPNSATDNIATLLLFFSVPTNEVAQFSTATANPALTYIGSFTMTSTGCSDVYDCAGNQFVAQTGLDFTGLNNSNSFTNYTGAAAANHLSVPTSYTVFLYSDGEIEHKQTVTFKGLNLPQGTFIAGGGQQANNKQGFTAFTDSGFVVTAPEPSSLSLLAGGLLALGALIRRKR